ncbi:hypothetical protein BP5796_00962 [Coleophoma crateriformis]|uniref:Uncharacterized protein n=1 Tax=Coleophoma crateriformis TaxID=565419 RepID=A0A3D8T9E9_9HELO|nr:hypothetical protein BP5796_00962 [Coleophoma crateriformis]
MVKETFQGWKLALHVQNVGASKAHPSGWASMKAVGSSHWRESAEVVPGCPPSNGSTDHPVTPNRKPAISVRVALKLPLDESGGTWR